ncbi:MAG TPA: sulfatase-like hydrolase/transferase [Thermoanaerobaculia bacterium]|nr:sulfatase-like hydrolase/transferase [Thermoanaerobaculia bacterium]
MAATLALVFACRKRSGPTNVLLVTIDTVRADHLGAYGFHAAETPNLDRLATEGVRFDDAMSAVPLTLPSHATILSGLLPPHHGLRNNGAGKFPADRDTLATRFAAAGYRTGAFVGAFVLDHRFGLARGFDTYDDEIPRDPSAPSALEAERPGREVVDRALGWLGKPDTRPFFAWVHLYDAHAPYDPPEPFRSRHTDSPYDGEIASVDAQVGRLFQWLDANGRAKDTIVAVAADHGESLGEHGELTHGFFLYQPTLHVPLLLRAPGLSRGSVVRLPVSLTDLAPTLAGLARLPLASTDGRDLSASLLSGRAPPAADLYAETQYPRAFGWSGLTALRRRNLKFIEAPRSELFDLASDSAESRNLLGAGSSRPDLAARIAEFQRGERAPESAGPNRSEDAARLASLGYITPSAAAPPPGGGLRDPKDMAAAFRKFEDAHWDLVGGRLKEAREKLTAVVGEDPGNPIFLDTLGHAYRRLGDYPTAIAWYRKAVAASPDASDTRYDLAVTLQEAGRFPEALQEIEQALQRDPSRPEAFDVLGIARLSEGKPDEALAQFDKAAELDPTSARTQNNRGNVLRELKRFEEAEAAYRRAIALAPSYADPWNGLGALEVEESRPKEAVVCFARAIALAPENHEARLNLGIALETAGDLDSAVAAYRDFLQASRNDPRFAQQRAVAARLMARLAQKESKNPPVERR